MQSSSGWARWAPVGYVTFLFMAAAGLATAGWASLDYHRTWLLAGAGVFAAGVFAYLLLDFCFSVFGRAPTGLPQADDLGEPEYSEQPEPEPDPGSRPVPSPLFQRLASEAVEFVPRSTTARAAGPAPSAWQEPNPNPPVPRLQMRTNGSTAPESEGPQYRPVRLTAVQRRPEIVKDLPLVKNILDDGPAVTRQDKPGKTRGQCSGCGTILWAPSVRPIKLRCPKCGHTATLEA